MSEKKSIAIIGGGAAGFFCAISAAKAAKEKGKSLDIKIFEASSHFLKKVKISGGGRCNVTHNCFDVKEFVKNYPRGSRELISPMNRFQAKDTVQFFRDEGIKLVAEADGRMFPESNSSETIIQCYMDLVKRYKIELLPNTPIKSIEVQGPNQFILKGKDDLTFKAEAVMIATGSSQAGYELATSLGHTISERAPSLFSFKIQDPLIKDLQGLSFPSSLKLTLKEKTFKQEGPTLVTHWGLSGPAILKLSAWAAREMKHAGYKGTLIVNWMGTSTQSDIEKQLQQMRDNSAKSFIKNVYPEVLPNRFWLSLLAKFKLDPDKKWASVSNKELTLIAKNLTASELEIQGQNRYKDEFVECGGVDLPEIDFKSMQSKIHKGLYFAGEILDIDGITGGFNFQNAWTGGWIAAQDMVNWMSAPH